MDPLNLVRSFPVAESVFYHTLKYQENVRLLRESLSSLDDDQFAEVLQRLIVGEPLVHILRELGMFPQPDQALVDIFSAAAEALYGQGKEAEGEGTQDEERGEVDGGEVLGVHTLSPETGFDEMGTSKAVREPDEKAV